MENVRYDHNMVKVTILMSTFNGDLFLEEQLKSLFKQRNVSINILVRDDGSTDGTIQILEKYKKVGLLDWYTGKNLKPAKSFLDLLQKASFSDYYAFCDQDDYWIEDKLEIALHQLEKYKSDKPALYYGCPRLTDENLKLIKIPKTSRESMQDFQSALIESNATGCTMVFNYTLAELIKQKSPDYVGMHDRWIHKVCIAVKGILIFDKDVHILYRQHSNNVIGVSNSVIHKVRRRVLNTDCNRSRTVNSLLLCYSEFLTENEIKSATLVANYKRSVIDRLKLLFYFNIKCKYPIRNIMFRIMVLLGTY